MISSGQVEKEINFTEDDDLTIKVGIIEQIDFPVDVI